MKESNINIDFQKFIQVRKYTEGLCSNLEIEDFVVQAAEEVSPTKWHLAHTTWFFETFLLKPHLGTYKEFHPRYSYLFNSYYNAVGSRTHRFHRGLMTRPTVAEIMAYREHVNQAMEVLLSVRGNEELANLLELGVNHEQQHQELIITDIKHALSFNPQFPAIVGMLSAENQTTDAVGMQWQDFPTGEFRVGFDGGFCFDNETPRHKVYLAGFRLANRPVTNGEYLEFILDKGYENFAHWFSEGWTWVNNSGARAPLYWQQIDDQWFNYTASGLQPVNPSEPACHLNYYEASAFASWAGKRLPTEFEWEIAAASADRNGQFLDRAVLHPQPAQQKNSTGPLQMFGGVWEWTQSAYLPYPGFRPSLGTVGEYNGKFMVNQWVLRGGSCATPENHIRASYRNFFPVTASWQFSGVRLADDID